MVGSESVQPVAALAHSGRHLSRKALVRNMHIRHDRPSDATAIRAVNEAAFDSSVEADIIEVLKKDQDSLVSLVAESDSQIVGHILFSPVSLAGHAGIFLMGLGPMAVLPTHQRQSIGSTLVREGLNRCRMMGCDAVVVLGHPEYYPRFGFVPASSFGISCEYDAPDEVFMLVELQPGSLQGANGKVIYHEAFAQ